jgi:hypothetical protein
VLKHYTLKHATHRTECSGSFHIAFVRTFVNWNLRQTSSLNLFPWQPSDITKSEKTIRSIPRGRTSQMNWNELAPIPGSDYLLHTATSGLFVPKRNQCCSDREWLAGVYRQLLYRHCTEAHWSPWLWLNKLLGLVKTSTFTETSETEHEHKPN